MFQCCVWRIPAAESGAVDGRQQCRYTVHYSAHSACSLAWNLLPTHLHWRLLWLQKTSMTHTHIFLSSSAVYLFIQPFFIQKSKSNGAYSC